jgi:hypothetical protein
VITQAYTVLLITLKLIPFIILSRLPYSIVSGKECNRGHYSICLLTEGTTKNLRMAASRDRPASSRMTIVWKSQLITVNECPLETRLNINLCLL